MGVMRVTIDVNVPKDVILKIMNKVSREFFEKRSEYKKWYRVRTVEDGMIYEVRAYGIKLKFNSKIEALDDSRSRITLEASWNDITNVLTLGIVKSQARFGIDTAILQLLCIEQGYQEGLKAER